MRFPAVGRTLGATQFGAFSLAYLTFGFALNASRGLSIEPLLIRFSGTDLPTWRRAGQYGHRTARGPGLGSLRIRGRVGGRRHDRAGLHRTRTDAASTAAAG